MPNGKLLGQQLGDRYPSEEAWQRLKSGGGTFPGMKNVSKPVGKMKPSDDEEGPGCTFN